MGKIGLISIIVPVYNTDKVKLKRCIDSIYYQTYTDYEAIVVDDGSRNELSRYIDELVGNTDNRFITVHKSNGGVSSARNTGLDIAKGEWIVFVDSDDYLYKNHLEAMSKAMREDVDLVMTGFEFIRKDTKFVHKYIPNVYIGKRSMADFILKSDFLSYQIPWDRSYRKSNLRFDENLSLSEDRLYCYQFLIGCKGIAAISDITYCHDGTDEKTLSYMTYSSKMNEHRAKMFDYAIKNLVREFGEDEYDKQLLYDYRDAIYTDLINAYKKEKKLVRYYITRVLHKLRHTYLYRLYD